MLGKNLGILGLCLILLGGSVQAGGETHLTSLAWEGNTLIMDLDGSFEIRTMTLLDPDRLVIDFPQVSSALKRQRFEGSDGVFSVRVGQNDASEASGLRCRVVLDLARPVNFLFEEEERRLRVTLHEGPPPDTDAPEDANLAPRSESHAEPAATVALAQPAPNLEPALELPLVAESQTLGREPALADQSAPAAEKDAPSPVARISASPAIPAFPPAVRIFRSRSADPEDQSPSPLVELAMTAAQTPASSATTADVPRSTEPADQSASAALPVGEAQQVLLITQQPVNDDSDGSEAPRSVAPAPEDQPTRIAASPEAKHGAWGTALKPPLVFFGRASHDETGSMVQDLAAKETSAGAAMSGSSGGASILTPPSGLKHLHGAAEGEASASAGDEAQRANGEALQVAAAATQGEEPVTPSAEKADAPAQDKPAAGASPPPGLPLQSGLQAGLGAASYVEATYDVAPAPTGTSSQTSAAAPDENAVQATQGNDALVVETWTEKTPGAGAVKAAKRAAESIALGEKEAMAASVVKPSSGGAAPMGSATGTLAGKSLAQAQPKAASGAAQPTSLMTRPANVRADGEMLDLEMRGAEFRTLLRAFSEFSGYNIIAGNEVKGKVSVKLQNVPWRHALESVCNSYGFGVKEENGILRVAPRQALLNEEIEKLTAEKKRMEYEPLQTRVVKMHYAVAAELTDPLRRMLSERGQIDVDERTNSLLITDLPERVEQMTQLALELDHIMPQVEITARIVDVDYRTSRDLGIHWEALNLASHSADITGSAVVDGSFPDPISQFKLGTIRDFGELNLTLEALEKENKANIISNPRIMTMDNREANILVGKKIPLIVADEAGNAITQLTTIGIKLQVTPHINPDGQIMMYVHTEVSDLSSEATVMGGVIITTSESKTNVMVNDGETAVIAGLIKSSDSSTGNRVPVLGEIPILGYLFGYENASKDKRELIIFITPRILDENERSEIAPGEWLIEGSG